MSGLSGFRRCNDGGNADVGRRTMGSTAQAEDELIFLVFFIELNKFCITE